MIKNQLGCRVIFCSFCDNADQANYGAEFKDSLAEWKGRGWRMFKKGTDPEWKHICPECRENDRGDDFDS